MKTLISKPWIVLLPCLCALSALEAEEDRGAGAGRTGGRDREELVLARTRLAGGLLSSNLLAAVARAGVTGAVEFCSVRAVELTRSAGTTDGTGIRRVSHKPRNPANRADEGELRVLEDLRGRLVSGAGTPVVLTTNASGLVSGFVPIQLGQPLCLKCHGQPDREIAPSTMEVLRRLYPEDKATGFRLGELRGMWRVELPH
jgi:hypothetical protein